MVGWWVGWWLRFLLILRLSQPSLAGTGAWVELENTLYYISYSLLELVPISKLVLLRARHPQPFLIQALSLILADDFAMPL